MSRPKTLTTEQCEMIVHQLMQDHQTGKQREKAFRNGAMAIIMLETGIRVGEMCGLLIEDLWYLGQPVENLVVRKEIAKNKKERIIPISSKLAETIKIMNETIWSKIETTDKRHAFFTVDPGRPMSTRTVERIIMAAGMKALNIEVTPHMLRHTFGSRMMRKTNSRIVQALLGHTSLQSTQIYMHPNSQDLRDAINTADS